jgi:hypothetical protein
VTGTCAECERFVCGYCSIEFGDTLYCRTCAPSAREAFTRRNKRSDWTFRRGDLGFGGRRRFRSFEAARRWARKLGLRSGSEWRAFVKRKDFPEDVPRSPHRYPEWKGMGDWLGTGNPDNRAKHANWRPFAAARSYARSLGLATFAEWKEFARSDRCPEDLPVAPETVYRGQYVSSTDWLGSKVIGAPNRNLAPFEKARAYARTLGIKTYDGWRLYAKGVDRGESKLPPAIPAAPWSAYPDEWKGIHDWLGIARISPAERRRRGLRSFAKARAFARSLGLQTKKEWHAFCRGDLPGKGKLPDDILTNPRSYPEFVSFSDWLGARISTYEKRKRRLPFAAARRFARSLGLRTRAEWLRFARGQMPELGRLPDGIPVQPWTKYREWTDAADWLGPTFTRKLTRYLPFKEARAWARTSGIKTYDEWSEAAKGRKQLPGRRASKLPPEIPAAPWCVYAREWKGIGDWLGTGNISNVEKHRRRVEAARRKARARS